MKKWIILGSLVGISSFLIYKYQIKPKQNLESLLILTEKRMLEILSRIKSAYRTSFLKHQKLFRNTRRKLEINSKEYSEVVFQFYSNLHTVLNEAIEDVLKEFNVSKKIYEDSWRLLKNEDVIIEAYEDMKTIVATGHQRKELDVETLRDCLEFCKSKIDLDQLTDEFLQLTVSIMEDELKSNYGFEIEDIERGYNAYMDNLDEYDSVFQAIREAKTFKDF